METSIVKGNNIFLRRIQLSDITSKYQDWLNDPDVNQFLETRFVVQTIESLEEYYNHVKNDKNTDFFAIIFKETQEHIGNIKLGPVNQIHKYAEISLFIGEKAYWNKGYATEAIKILAGYAFDTLNLNKLTAGAYANNIGSIKAFKKASFKEEALLKRQYKFKEQYIDRVCLCLFSND